ncbi:hypothetical protein J4230_03735 [Candidatus Woesearchaeota archaeon]|nr:hypothetical protein [Candidatus Woesearchaeota archaeon]
MQNRKLLILFLLFILIVIGGCTSKQESSPEKPVQQRETVQQPEAEDIMQRKQPMQSQQSWQPKGIAIEGTYADAEIVELEDGAYRIYYSIEPEVPGNKLEIFSSISADGINWKNEEGIIKEFATFPDIVKLPDGRFRMYFQNAGVIKSATSHDGLNWVDDPGVRIDKHESGFKLEDVGAQSTVQLDDGTYIMVYRGTISEPYQIAEKISNKDTHVYFWATSKDGLIFEKKGLAIDSRNDVLLGAADGAEWVKWDQIAGQAELRVYFWSYAGVYHVVYQDGIFSEPVFDFTNNQDKMAKFSPNPPGDPTLTKINGKWFMYYGQHTKGIYYATLEQQQELSQTMQSGEKLSIPPSIENSCIGFKIGGPNKTATINMIGAGWVTFMWPHFTWGRIEKEPGIFDFSEMDNIVKTAQENNVATLAELQPFADWDQAWDKNCKAKENSYLCKPKDMQAYKVFVSKTVERYDGDGESDMPGLKIPIKYWQIINEPDIKEDPYVIFFVGNEKDYFEVLKESYQTIKQVCADCKVLHGAAAGVKLNLLSFWDNFFKLGGADYFDIANIHYVGIDISTGKTVNVGDLSTLNTKPFKDLLDKHKIKKPIWVTEAVLKSSSAKSSLQGALSAGASKVFFVGFGIDESESASRYSADYKEITQLCLK